MVPPLLVIDLLLGTHFTPSSKERMSAVDVHIEEQLDTKSATASTGVRSRMHRICCVVPSDHTLNLPALALRYLRHALHPPAFELCVVTGPIQTPVAEQDAPVIECVTTPKTPLSQSTSEVTVVVDHQLYLRVSVEPLCSDRRKPLSRRFFQLHVGLPRDKCTWQVRVSKQFLELAGLRRTNSFIVEQVIQASQEERVANCN